MDEGTKDTGASSTGAPEDKSKVLAAELASAKKAAADAQAKLDKIERARKDADDKDRMQKGEHERLIAELKAQNESNASALKSFEEATKARASRLMERLPEPVREKVSKYEGKLALADWVSMIEDEVEMSSSNTPPPATPPGGTPRAGTPAGRTGERELQPKSVEILEMLAVDHDRARKLKAEQISGTNDYKFSDTILGFLKALKERARPRPAARNTEGSR